MSHEYAFPPERLGSSDASSFVPLYVQLANRISRLIHEQGDRVVGKALPSESECALVFAVSRPTVRQAMGRLLSQGLIKREKGRGTFVTRPRLAHDISHDFEDEMRLASHRVSYTVLEWARVTPPPEVLRVFAPASIGDLHLLRRLRSVDGELVGIEERFVPARVAARIRPEQLETESIFELLRQAETEPIAHIDMEVSGRVADRETCRLLRIKTGAPLLVRASTFRSARGTPLIHGTTSFVAEHYTFRFTVNFSGVHDAREHAARRTKKSTRSP